LKQINIFFIVIISWYGINGETLKIKKLCYTLEKHSEKEIVDEIINAINMGIKQ